MRMAAMMRFMLRVSPARLALAGVVLLPLALAPG